MDIKLEAYIRRIKSKSNAPPVSQPIVTVTQANSGAVKATVGAYDPNSDKLTGTLPTGEQVLMESLTNGSVSVNQKVVYEAGYYYSMPSG